MAYTFKVGDKINARERTHGITCADILFAWTIIAIKGNLAKVARVATRQNFMAIFGGYHHIFDFGLPYMDMIDETTINIVNLNDKTAKGFYHNGLKLKDVTFYVNDERATLATQLIELGLERVYDSWDTSYLHGLITLHQEVNA